MVANSAPLTDLTTTFGRLVEVYSTLERRLGRSLQQQCDIPHSWFEVLLRISRSDGQLAMSALAEQVALSTGGVTRIFDRIVAAGYAERVPCATDRRIVYAALTAAGQGKLAEAAKVHEANLREFFGSFSAAERRELDDLLDKLRVSTRAN